MYYARSPLEEIQARDDILPLLSLPQRFALPSKIPPSTFVMVLFDEAKIWKSNNSKEKKKRWL